ncbi:MAG: hypothetical protein KKC26_01155, partial [Nanoarchaeota archaeon]|nr:hypothetical protein [Nanoarchaeota archaeon]
SNEVDALDLDSFPDDYIEHSMFVQHYKIPKTDFIKVGSDLVHGFFVELSDGKRISCESEIKAFYIQYAVMNKKLSFRIPSENKHIKKIVDEYAKKLKELKKNIEKSLKFYVSDEKVKNKLFPDILNEVLKNVK